MEASRKARKRSGREKAEVKGSTCGTAVGAKQGRMKGNKQKAKYWKPKKRSMGNQVEEKVEKGEAERKNRSTGEAAEEAWPGRRERKNRRLSSRRRNRRGRKKPEGKGKARKRSGRKKAEKKGSTSGTAVGAKLGRTKGNKQKAEYL